MPPPPHPTPPLQSTSQLFSKRALVGVSVPLQLWSPIWCLPSLPASGQATHLLSLCWEPGLGTVPLIPGGFIRYLLGILQMERRRDGGGRSREPTLELSTFFERVEDNAVSSALQLDVAIVLAFTSCSLQGPLHRASSGCCCRETPCSPPCHRGTPCPSA